MSQSTEKFEVRHRWTDAERWFLMISPGDRPGATSDDGKETGGGFAARMALEWTLELCSILGFHPETALQAEAA